MWRPCLRSCTTEKLSRILQQAKLSSFTGVLTDFNHSRMETQSLLNSKYGYPSIKYGYCPTDGYLVRKGEIPKLAYSKAHDVYSAGIVSAQFIHFLNSKSKKEFQTRYQQGVMDQQDRSLCDTMKKQIQTHKMNNLEWNELVEEVVSLINKPCNALQNNYRLERFENLLCTKLRCHSRIVSKKW